MDLNRRALLRRNLAACIDLTRLHLALVTDEHNPTLTRRQQRAVKRARTAIAQAREALKTAAGC